MGTCEAVSTATLTYQQAAYQTSAGLGSSTHAIDTGLRLPLTDNSNSYDSLASIRRMYGVVDSYSSEGPINRGTELKPVAASPLLDPE